MEIDLETRGVVRGNLALALSVSVHVLIPVSFFLGSHVSLIIAIVISLGISQIQTKCIRSRSLAALWQCQLMWSALSAAACAALAATVLLSPSHHAFQEEWPVTGMAAVICAGCSLLCALGLERSGILRLLLTISVVAFSLLVVASVDVSSIFNENTKNNATLPATTASSVAHLTFMMLAGFLPTPSFPGEPFLLTTTKSFTSNALVAFIYCIIAFAFHQLYVDRVQSSTVQLRSASGVLLFEHLLPANWRCFLSAILSALCVGLSLPDLLLGACASSLRLCGRVIPRFLARQTHYTGTHVLAFVFSGGISTLLTLLFTTKQLIELVCFAYIMADMADSILCLYSRYQTTYRSHLTHHRKKGGEGSARYELLATSEGGVMAEEEEEEEQEVKKMSDDSGNSSDSTDIDAAVAEFRDRAKVVEDMSKPVVLEPTPESGRRAFIYLNLAVAMFVVGGLLLRRSYALTSLGPIFVGMGLLIAHSMLPRTSMANVTAEPESDTLLVSFCLLLDCLLITQAPLDTFAFGAGWHIIGQLFSSKYSSRQLQQMTQRLKAMTSSKTQPEPNHRDSLHILQ